MRIHWLVSNSFLLASMLLAGCGEHRPAASAPKLPRVVTPTPSPAQPAATISAIPPVISHGGTVTISWSVAGALHVTINGIPVGPRGSMQVKPKASAVYHLRALLADHTMAEAAASVQIAGIGGSPSAGGTGGGEFGPAESGRNDGLPEPSASARPPDHPGIDTAAPPPPSGGNTHEVSPGHEGGVSRAPASDQSAGPGEASGSTTSASSAHGGKKGARRPASAGATPTTAESGAPSHTPNANTDQRSLEQQLENLPEGKIGAHYASPMEVNQQERFTVLVSRDLNMNPTQVLGADVAQPGQTIQDVTKIEHLADTVKITVESADFTIVKADEKQPEEQSVGNEPATWTFNVTPLKEGSHAIYVTATNIVRDSSNRSAERKFPPKTFAVDVHVAPFHKVAGQFISRNWQWLLTTLILPALGFLWKAFGKKAAAASA